MGPYHYSPHSMNYNNQTDHDKEVWEWCESNDIFELKTVRMSKIQQLDETELSVKHRILQNVLASIIDNVAATQLAHSTDVNNYLSMAHQMIRDEDMKILLTHVKYPEPQSPLIRAFDKGLREIPEDIKQKLPIINYFSMLTFIEYSLQSYTIYTYNHETSLERPYAPKVILHIILQCLETYDLQYTPRLAYRIFNLQLLSYPTKRNEFAANLIDHVRNLQLRRRIQNMDTERYKRSAAKDWKFEEFILAPLVEYAKGGKFTDFVPEEKQENDSYNNLLMQIMHAYTQIEQNPQNLANMINADCVIPDVGAIEHLVPDNTKESQLIYLLKQFRTLSPSFPSALANEFIDHALFFCSDLAKDDGGYNKEVFIVRRMAEIIRGNPSLHIHEFIESIKTELTRLSLNIYAGNVSKFKTNLVDSLTNAFNKLYSEVHHQETGYDLPLSPVPPPPPRNHDGIYPMEPPAVMSPQPPPEWGDDEAGDHNEHRYPSEPDVAQDDTDIPEFVRDITIPHAVNRFEGVDVTNTNKNIEQKPFFTVSVQSDDKERNERELLNAAKRNAQHEYYKQMTKNETKEASRQDAVDPSMRFNPAFIKAEQDLSEIRGKVMTQYITVPSTPDDPELISMDQGDYNQYIMELGAYLHTHNGKIVPLLKHPIKQTTHRQSNDIFTEFPRKAKMAETLMLLNHTFSKERWENAEKTKTLDDGSEINIPLDPHEVLQDIQYVILQPSKQFKQSDDGKMKLESNYREWDATARKATIESEHIIFSHHGQKASFQYALNIPQFTRREIYHSEYALKRANLDFAQHNKHLFSRFVDLKARLVTADGHNVELTWTIHKHTEDTFHMTHLTYKSRNPDHTLLTPPKTLSDVVFSPHDFMPETVGVHYSKIKDEKIYKVDELKLIQLHAQGVRECGKAGLNRIIPNESSKSFGIIYTYDFWTLIGTCFKIEATSTNEYLTCYTIIHRSSDFAQLRERKRLREASDSGRSQDTTEGSYTRPVIHRQPAHAPVRRVHRERALPKGNNWFVFGIVDSIEKDMYYFIPQPSNDTRQLLNRLTGVAQSKVYKEFYPQTIDASARLGKTLTQYISGLIENRMGIGAIKHNPGMFCTWMKLYPKGQRPDVEAPVEGLFHTAKQYWTHLWKQIIDGHQIRSQQYYAEQNGPDHRMQAFEDLYKSNEEPADQEHHPHGGRGGRMPSHGRPPNDSDYYTPNTPFRGGGGYRGRGRGRGRGAASSFSSRDQYYHYSPHIQESYTPTEDPPQISSMQYEIDTLRRSLNQLALLQS